MYSDTQHMARPSDGASNIQHMARSSNGANTVQPVTSQYVQSQLVKAIRYVILGSPLLWLANTSFASEIPSFDQLLQVMEISKPHRLRLVMLIYKVC